MTDTTTTAEVIPMISLSKGSMYGLTIYADRKPLANGGLGKGRKAGTIVQTNLVDLLNDVVRLCNEQGFDTLDDLAAFLEEKQ